MILEKALCIQNGLGLPISSSYRMFGMAWGNCELCTGWGIPNLSEIGWHRLIEAIWILALGFLSTTTYTTWGIIEPEHHCFSSVTLLHPSCKPSCLLSDHWGRSASKHGFNVIHPRRLLKVRQLENIGWFVRFGLVIAGLHRTQKSTNTIIIMYLESFSTQKLRQYHKTLYTSQNLITKHWTNIEPPSLEWCVTVYMYNDTHTH